MGGEQTDYSKTNPVCEGGGGSLQASGSGLGGCCPLGTSGHRAGQRKAWQRAWRLPWACLLSAPATSSEGQESWEACRANKAPCDISPPPGLCPGSPQSPTAAHRRGTRELRGCKSFVGTRSLSRRHVNIALVPPAPGSCSEGRSAIAPPAGTALASIANTWTEVAVRALPLERAGCSSRRK